MDNLYKQNLETVSNLKENQSLSLRNEHQLTTDDRYFANWRGLESMQKIIDVYQTSFYHYLNLIQMPNPSLMSSCQNLSKLNQTEFKLGVILLLDQSLNGLSRYHHYLEYLKKTEEATNISKLITKLRNDLENYKASVGNLDQYSTFDIDLIEKEYDHITHSQLTSPVDQEPKLNDEIKLDEEPQELEINIQEDNESEPEIPKTFGQKVFIVFKAIGNWISEKWNNFINFFY